MQEPLARMLRLTCDPADFDRNVRMAGRRAEA